jgi:hypothetical protein
MKLILITLVAVVVGLMVGCESASRTSMSIPTTAPVPVATPPPAYSDAEVLGAVKEYLATAGRSWCQTYGNYHLVKRATVRRDPSNPDKYFVTTSATGNQSTGGSWTFIGSLAKVISTSTGSMGSAGC